MSGLVTKKLPNIWLIKTGLIRLTRNWITTRRLRKKQFEVTAEDWSYLLLRQKEDLHIGVVGLTRINWVHRYADLVIVIGDRKYRRIPYTIEAHELMHKVAFLRLNLLNVRSFYASNNKGAIAVQKLFKYTKVGVYENLYTIDGKRVDLVTGMLSKEVYLKKLHP